MILGRSFLAIIHARIDVFNKEILLWVGEDRIIFDMNGNVHHPVVLIEKVCVTNEVQGEESFNPLEIGDDLFSYDPPLRLEFKKYNHMCETNQNNKDTIVSNNVQEQCEGEKGMTKMVEPETTALRLHYCKRLQEWLKLKIGHTNVNKSVKNVVLNEWVIDCFEEESKTSKDPYSRSLEEYKLVFDIKIEQLADEYELGIGKKGYILDDI
ncbi:hypothetical protein Tco_1476588 [Tanacetum coccineum]